MKHDAEDQSYVRGDYPDVSAKPEIEVSLLAVLEAFAFEPPTPGDEGVIDALASTGASKAKRLEAIGSANNQGMLLHGLFMFVTGGRYQYFALSNLGLETLDKLRFDKRTRITGKFARDILGEIEKEMSGED